MTITIEQIHEPANALANALSGTRDKSGTRDDMASLYADMLRAGCREWGEINAAIVARWPKGLVYIKEKAWRLARKG